MGSALLTLRKEIICLITMLEPFFSYPVFTILLALGKMGESSSFSLYGEDGIILLRCREKQGGYDV